ncbi:FecR family protein [Flagellimonas olearia]|uniref:DUF4974 domain-containing protein n=1 Tax=Flagellimonas olearia TaxID=552546 RepID=A0A444VHX0_9FLAO|nr:FecR domain-containing protein [Allomuricauda olearia]RYC50358.1 hypothetical protein DN53_05385 [Allomuricauda olearia]
MDPAIETLIVKFLANEANRDELLALEEWVKKNPNAPKFVEHIKVNVAVNRIMDNYDAQHTKTVLINHIDQKQAHIRRKQRTSILKYAALLILALGLGYVLTQQVFDENGKQSKPVIVDNQIQVGSDRAILTLEDGSKVTLEKGANYQSQNATSNGEEIVYAQTTVTETAFNTITVPRGGQFFVQLSDGTKVWLNAESQLRYPVSFPTDHPRTVDLVYGEAYFEVAPSTENNGTQFQVNHFEQTIEVLGTQFNVKAYKDETKVRTTLVEGRVALEVQGRTSTLGPGFQAVWDRQVGTLSTAQVDVYDQISWKEGVFSFNRMALGEIMKVLSRWYDMEAVFEDPKLAQQGFTGALGREQEITEILDNIKDFDMIETYAIKGNTITLK